MLHLSGFIASSVFGVVGHRFSARNMAFLGSLIQGISVFLFGMLELFDDKATFLTMSFLLRNVPSVQLVSIWIKISFHYSRALEGVGSSIAMSAFSVIFIHLYPEKVGTITSWSETALGVGYSTGPAIGGLFYDIGGFHLPFLAIGIANILFAIIIILALPKEDSKTCITTTDTKSGGSYTPMIKIITEVM